MSVKTGLITGANEGIGFYTSMILARKKFKIIMVDKNDMEKSRDKIIKKTGNHQIICHKSDFSSLNSVKKLVDHLYGTQKNLDILINNVGVFSRGNQRTIDGLLETMQINHFAPFLLTHLLQDLLKKSAPSRVIFLTSVGAFFSRLTLKSLDKANFFTYYNTKLCNMIISNYFAEILKPHKVTCNSMHPGMTATNFLASDNRLMQFIIWTATQNIEEAAKKSAHLASALECEGVTGKYFVNYHIHEQPAIVDNQKFCQDLWKLTEIIVGLK